MMAGVKSIGERKFPIILLKTNEFSSNFAVFMWFLRHMWVTDPSPQKGKRNLLYETKPLPST